MTRTLLLLLFGFAPAFCLAEADPIAEGSWTLAVLPDTQNYAEAYPQHYDTQTRWLAEHAGSHNLRFAIHEGDVTNRNTPEQWDNALASMKVLNGCLPYAIAPGNHDYGPAGNAADRASFFNDPKYFGPKSPYASQPSLGGYFEDAKTDNTWHTFEAGGQRWLVIALEFAPRDEAVAWANEIVAEHADLPAILGSV